MTRRFIQDEEDASLLNGILQNGMHLRVPMFLRDGITPNPALSERQRAIAAATHDTATFDASTFDASLHKPGYRRATGTNDAAAKRDAAYNDYQDWITDAWKSKAPPAGSYPAANGANEGDACTINGSPGKLRAIAGHDGWLQCVADTNNDSRRDAQQTMDAAYAEYDLRIQNSWRNQS